MCKWLFSFCWKSNLNKGFTNLITALGEGINKATDTSFLTYINTILQRHVSQGVLLASPYQWERFLQRYLSVRVSLHPYGSWVDWTMLRSLYRTWRRQQLCTGMCLVPRWALLCLCLSMGFTLCLWSSATPNWSSCTLWEKRAPLQASCRRTKPEECTTSASRWAAF